MRSSEYLEYPVAGSDNPEECSLNIFGITETISPEQLVTEQLVGLLNYTSSLQVLSFANDQVRMVIVQARKGGLLIDREIIDINQHLPEGVDCQICAIYRNNRLIVPTPQTVIIEGDEVLFAADINSVEAIMRELRPKEARTRRIMIAGGGNIGYRLAKQLESKYDIKIIEYKPHRAEWLAENLDNTLVLQGSATDETLLDEEYIDEIDVFCALTNDDENNIMPPVGKKPWCQTRNHHRQPLKLRRFARRQQNRHRGVAAPDNHRFDTRPHPPRRHCCRPSFTPRYG